jgi:hypothetical protein
MSEHLVRELIKEIKADRIARAKADRAVDARLTRIEARVEDAIVAIAVVAKDLVDFRKLALEGERNLIKQVRLVSDFAGMTDPEPNGNGNGHGE